MFHTKTVIQKPDCVLMDIDNTIYEYSPCHKAGISEAKNYANSALNISMTDFDQCFMQARTQIKNRLGEQAASHSRLLYFQRLLEIANLGSQPKHALILEQIYWQSFMSEAKLFSEVEDFMDDLRIEGIPLVLITDLTAAIQMRKFLHWGLGRYTDWLVTSEENGIDKPSPDIFELALAKIGGVEGEIWMIGDNYEKDIVGAKNALNCTTFLRKTGKVKNNKSAADFEFKEFQELRTLLRNS